MKLKRTVAALITAVSVLSLTACGKDEQPILSNSGAGTSTIENASNNSSSTSSAAGEEKEQGMWDIIPEIPVTEESAFKYNYDSELGGMVITDYLKESPKVRIPDTLEGEPVVKVDFFQLGKELTELIMPDSVKEFELSNKIKKSLQYINIPKEIQKAVYETDDGYERIIEDVNRSGGLQWGFNGFTSLTSVYIPDGMTTYGFCVFPNCTSLTNVNIPDGVTVIGQNAFNSCTNLTSINIPDSVTLIQMSAFAECTSLNIITIPDSVTRLFFFRGGGYDLMPKNITVKYKDQTYDYDHMRDLQQAVMGN